MTTNNQAPQLTPDDIPEEFTLEGLRQHFTDEEIAAMNEGDDPILPDVDLSQKATAQSDGEEEADDPIEDDQQDDQPEPEQAPVAAADDDQPDPELPMPVNVDEFRQKIESLDQKIADLQEQYDNADLTSAEWRTQLAAIVKEQAKAQAGLDAAEAQAAELAPKAEAYRNAWFDKVRAYQAQHPYLAQPEHFDAWDAALRMVNSNEAYAALKMSQRIEQAHRIYAAHFEGVEGKPLPTKPGLSKAQKAEAQAVAEQQQRRTDARPEAPTTLAGLTNAADAGLEDGRFAQIERVADADPMKAEALFAAMSEADQIAFLASV